MPRANVRLCTMSTIRDGPRRKRNGRFETALDDETRRRVVRCLHGEAGAVTARELVDRIATATTADPESDAMESLRNRLHHVHLPKLVDCGLVDWDREAGTVSATDRLSFAVTRLAASPADDGDDSTARALADERRREVLAVLESGNGSITRQALAHELARRESDERSSTPSAEAIEGKLHHRHLPILERADLVEYDHADGIVTARDATESVTAFDGIGPVS